MCLVPVTIALWQARGELVLPYSRWFSWMVQQQCEAPLLHHPKTVGERRRRDPSESQHAVATATKHYLKDCCGRTGVVFVKKLETEYVFEYIEEGSEHR